MVNPNKAITAYVGGRPGGRPAPYPLSTVPVNYSGPDNLAFFYTLAFAQDRGYDEGTVPNDGNFQVNWDSAITPAVSTQLQEANGWIGFRASLGGDAGDWPWVPPSNQSAWVNNATSSLLNLIETYNLEGIDIDYEGNPSPDPNHPVPLDQSFVDCMSQVINNIGNETGKASTVAPFGFTADSYLDLYQQAGGGWIAIINYQAYADSISDVNGYVDLYATLAQQYGGYEKLALGIASATGVTPDDPPRGLQPPDIYTAWTQLRNQGIIGAAIWDLEDSALYNPPFSIETTIISTS
jgi:hypothetical protein